MCGRSGAHPARPPPSSSLAQTEAAGGLKKAIFQWAYDRKLWYMREGGYRHDAAAPLSDALVFSKVRAVALPSLPLSLAARKPGSWCGV